MKDKNVKKRHIIWYRKNNYVNDNFTKYFINNLQDKTDFSSVTYQSFTRKINNYVWIQNLS